MRALVLVPLVALSLCAPEVAAQPKTPQDTNSAIVLARDAKTRFDARKFDEAYTLFEAAEAKAHSPVLVLYMARCRRQLSKLLAARELYRRAAAEVADAKTPPQFKTAIEEAKRELAELEPQIPRVIILAPGFPSGTVLELDGASVTETAAAAGIQVDPGAHKAVARNGDQILATADVNAELTKSVTATLSAPTTTPDKPIDKPKEEPDAPQGPAAQPTESGGSFVPGAVVLSVGVAGLAVAIGTRVVAFDIVDDVRSRCFGDHCAPAEKTEIDRAVALQTASTICFVVGGAAAAVGIILLAVRPGGAESPAVALEVGPSRLSLSGTF
ncbi:MAG: hypothetical protein U0271_38300 [Polyangiaceae bacterium]